MRETRLTPDCFILPLFVCEGRGVRREVSSMPGVFQLSVDEAVKEAAAAKADGPVVRCSAFPTARSTGSKASDPYRRAKRGARAQARGCDLIGSPTGPLLVTSQDTAGFSTARHLNDVPLACRDPALALRGSPTSLPPPTDGRARAAIDAPRRSRTRRVGIMSYAAEVLLRILWTVPRCRHQGRSRDSRSHSWIRQRRLGLREVETDIEEGRHHHIKPRSTIRRYLARQDQFRQRGRHTREREYAMLKLAYSGLDRDDATMLATLPS